MLHYLWTFEGNTIVTLALVLPTLAVVFIRCYCEMKAARADGMGCEDETLAQEALHDMGVYSLAFNLGRDAAHCE